MVTAPTSPQNPVSEASEIETELLPRLDTDDAALNTRHPFLAYKETNRSSGAWRVRIQSRHAATAVLYPNAIRLQARAVSEKGQSYFTWTYTATARSGNPEPIEFRVLVNDGEPAAIEILPRAAKSNAAIQPPPVKYPWPAA
jgi:hypothetical protein